MIIFLPGIIRMIFWVHIKLDKNRHLDAIGQLLSSFEQRLMELPCLMHNDYENIIKQIMSLKSLKNDYGFTSLGSGDPVEIDQKLKLIERQAEVLLEKSVQQLKEEEELKKERYLIIFLKRSPDSVKAAFSGIRVLLGLQEAQRLLLAFSDDIPAIFVERLHSIQARLLAVQDLGEELMLLDKEQMAECQLKGLNGKLEQEVRHLEDEIELLGEKLSIVISGRSKPEQDRQDHKRQDKAG